MSEMTAARQEEIIAKLLASPLAKAMEESIENNAQGVRDRARVELVQTSAQQNTRLSEMKARVDEANAKRDALRKRLDEADISADELLRQLSEVRFTYASRRTRLRQISTASEDFLRANGLLTSVATD